MKGLNRAYLIGHIGHDPELRTTQSGQSMLKISLATPRSQKVNDVWVEAPDWHRLTAFGQEAEFLAKYGQKGNMLAVECAIRPNRWTDKEGHSHWEVSLIIDRVLLLHGRNRVETVGTEQEVEIHNEENIPF